jgi:hypothetical protein
VARICAPRSTVRVGFRTPFVILPLTKGGGGSGIERASLNDLDWEPRSMDKIGFLDPLCLSTFNKGGGGGGVRNG